MRQPHFAHVHAHLERVRDGYSFIPDPESVYLGHQEDGHFWELVGLRLQGCPVIVLAALRFRRRELPGVMDARESLADYLSPSPAPEHGDPGQLTLILPNKDQEIPQFLNGLRAGRSFSPVTIDRMRVELAFDFRADSPAAVRDKRAAAAPLRLHYYRTVGGHVFKGESHHVGTPLDGAATRFVAVRAVEQVVPDGSVPLPTLFVAHRFISLQADVTEQTAKLAARNWMPFFAETASSEGLIPIA